MSLKNYLAILFLLFISKCLLSQSIVLGDTLRIEFVNTHFDKNQSVEKANDLSFKIIIKNISDRKVYSYSELVFDKSPNIFANYDVHLCKKVGNKYEVVNYYPLHSRYGYYFDSLYVMHGAKATSLINLFDIDKKPLNSQESDTLSFNLLNDCGYLDSGDYKLKIFFRVKTIYKSKNGEIDVEEIKYINSKWYYLKVLKPLRLSN